MNVFEKIAVKVGKVIAYPFVHVTEVIEVLETALKDEPAIKTAVVGLIKQIETVSSDATVAVALAGANLTDDMATVAASETLFAYVKSTFLPAIEAAYKDIAADIESSTTSTTSTTSTSTTSDAVITGAGLHTVTAA